MRGSPMPSMFPYTTLFRSRSTGKVEWEAKDLGVTPELILAGHVLYARTGGQFTRLKDGEIVERGPYGVAAIDAGDRKSTRLNSSHVSISYAVFCLKKKNKS